MNRQWIAIGILVILVFATIFGMAKKSETELGPNQTFTKAICDGTSCADFLIYCSGDKLIKKEQVTGFVVFPEDWKDPRSPEGLCE